MGLEVGYDSSTIEFESLGRSPWGFGFIQDTKKIEPTGFTASVLIVF